MGFFEEDDKVHRMPPVLVALAATVVCSFLSIPHFNAHSISSIQVYGSLQERKTGKLVPLKFAAEPFANIHDDHLATLELIKTGYEGKDPTLAESYKPLMAKIFATT